MEAGAQSGDLAMPPCQTRTESNTNPIEHERSQLRILNSLTRKKDLFAPNEARTIKWYSCGPTVYDVAHLGHARCYVTFDIIRRILTDYFGYQVFYVMNITDIDDKIIKRARSNHLCDQFILAASKDILEHLPQIQQALENYQKRRAQETDPAKLELNAGVVKKSSESFEKLKSVANCNHSSSDELRQILENLRDVIADEQDDKLAHTVTDLQIFKALTLKYEQEYHEDMQLLDVLPPSALTRVSEFIDETGLYLKKLEANGFAYRVGGSVYFDTSKFDSDPKHSYAKLVREAFGQKKFIDEGEGELSVNQQDAKRSPNDFALWKKSKVGEPSWKTQDYEDGRPGWHIECSVMASHMLGENFDIHSGGCDLKFPHHDNEIAQAEAYYNTGHNWVNYFIHSGHLTISGCKMSKSLKNFISIKHALQDYTSRQLRFAFLAHSWADTLDYSPNTMNTAICYEKTFNEFFLNVADALRRQRTTSCYKKWTADDQELNQQFLSASNKVHVALCDNFDTRSVLNILSALVKESNKRPNTDLILLRDIASYIRRMLSVFGASFDEIKASQAAYGTSVFKYVETLAQFRADVKRISKISDPSQQILALCDRLRDQTLPNLGVRLEDREVDGVPYVVKFVDTETISKERALAKKRLEENLLKEETLKLEKLKLQHQREEKARMPPEDMFRSQVDKYSKFDDKGLPTHDAAGKEISKSALKKLQRLYTEQETRYSKYIVDQQQQQSTV